MLQTTRFSQIQTKRCRGGARSTTSDGNDLRSPRRRAPPLPATVRQRIARNGQVLTANGGATSSQQRSRLLTTGGRTVCRKTSGGLADDERVAYQRDLAAGERDRQRRDAAAGADLPRRDSPTTRLDVPAAPTSVAPSPPSGGDELQRPSGAGVNTAIPYLYRDAANYKQHQRLVLPGAITAAARAALAARLHLGCYFKPSWWGWKTRGNAGTPATTTTRPGTNCVSTRSASPTTSRTVTACTPTSTSSWPGSAPQTGTPDRTRPSPCKTCRRPRRRRVRPPTLNRPHHPRQPSEPGGLCRSCTPPGRRPRWTPSPPAHRPLLG
jgi:hypothetical protein